MPVSLSGFNLARLKIHEQVGAGTFGIVYRATDEKNNLLAVKVARPGNELTTDSETNSKNFLPTQALCLFSGGYNEIHPSPASLLEVQKTRSKLAAGILPETNGPFTAGSNHYISMEFIKGMTLRQLLNHNLVIADQHINDIDLAIKVLDALVALKNSKLEYHGDLKPENIILSGAGVRIIDPGYFGPLASEEGMIPRAVISTTQYYPLLEPDDSFAIGCMLWEICLGYHPLMNAEKQEQAGSQKKAIGTDLQAQIAVQELMGRYFLSPLSFLQLPQEKCQWLAADQQDLFLSLVGLRKDQSHRLELAPALSAQEALQAMRRLKESGINSFRVLT
jgi:serine/threonine protein kinase